MLFNVWKRWFKFFWSLFWVVHFTIRQRWLKLCLGAGQAPIDYLNQLDMSTARRRLKSPQSLYGTSTHPTMVTHRSQSWSWMIDSHPFHSMSIKPQIRLFQILTLKLRGQGHRSGERSRSHSLPSIQPMHLLFVSHQSDQPFLRYVQWSVWPWKNTSEKKEFPTEFLQNLITW